MDENSDIFPKLETVREFYKGRSVFLTGFTGFLGKVLAEKLLWSCPEIKAIYILIRSNKKKTALERLKPIYDCLLFDRLRERDGEKWIEKLIPVEGDLYHESFGIEENQLKEITSSVTIVFHSAARILFNDPLIDMIGNNVVGTKNLCDLATKIEKLDSFLYISTAYSNCYEREIQERVYKPQVDWQVVLKICDKIDPAQIAALATKYINPHPNTYVFTKHVAESVVDSYKHVIPVSIIRPTIVVSTGKKPLPGWSDSRYGPNMFLLGTSTGIMTSQLIAPDVRSDFIFVDSTVNGAIVAAIRRSKLPKIIETPVYNAASRERSLTNRQFSDYVDQEYIRQDVSKYGLILMRRLITSKFWYIVDFIPRSVISAFLLDAILKLFGKPPLLVKFRLKVYESMMAVYFFLSTSFDFHNEKFLSLLESIHEDDKDEFIILVPQDTVERDQFVKNVCLSGYEIGFKKVLAKELIARSHEIRHYIKGLVITDTVCFYSFFLFLIYVGFKLFPPAYVILMIGLFVYGYTKHVQYF